MSRLPYPNCYSRNRFKNRRSTRLSVVLGLPKSPARLSASHTMKVTEKDVAYVADLANLELTEDERGLLLRDLNSILEYVDRLNQLDTANVPPMAQMSDRYGVDPSKAGNARFGFASREDIHEGLRKSLPQDVALQNAPDSDGTFFKVPKVIER